MCADGRCVGVAYTTSRLLLPATTSGENRKMHANSIIMQMQWQAITLIKHDCSNTCMPRQR